MEIVEKVILENQLVIMRTLLSMIMSKELTKELEDRIKYTEAVIRAMS